MDIKKYFFIVYLILISLLCYLISDTVMIIINKSLGVVPGSSAYKGAALIPQVEAAIKPFSEYKVIIDRNLFGVASTRQQSKPTNPLEIPVTAANLLLLGK